MQRIASDAKVSMEAWHFHKKQYLKKIHEFMGIWEENFVSVLWLTGFQYINV